MSAPRPPDSLVLEITEGLLADDRERSSAGCRRSNSSDSGSPIDDFGTGYSALSHLQHLPVDILKIDQSFIDQLNGDPQNANLVEGIINLGESLDVDVIAEGIEQPQQAERLRAIRATLGQGFLYSPPTDPGATPSSSISKQHPSRPRQPEPP